MKEQLNKKQIKGCFVPNQDVMIHLICKDVEKEVMYSLLLPFILSVRKDEKCWKQLGQTTNS